MADAFPTFKGLGFDRAMEMRLSNELDRLCRIAGVPLRSLEASDLALRMYARQMLKPMRAVVAPRSPSTGRPLTHVAF